MCVFIYITFIYTHTYIYPHGRKREGAIAFSTPTGSFGSRSANHGGHVFGQFISKCGVLGLWKYLVSV